MFGLFRACAGMGDLAIPGRIQHGPLRAGLKLGQETDYSSGLSTSDVSRETLATGSASFMAAARIRS